MSSYGIPGVPMLPPSGPGVSSVPMELPKDVVRVGEQALWSTARLSAAALVNTTTRLFTTPLGQQGQGFTSGLTLSETNLKEGGRIPAGLAYDTYGIATIFQPVNDGAVPGQIQFLDVRDVQNIYNNGCLSWDFLQTVIDVAPVSLIGAGGGIFGTNIDTSGASNRATLNNGAGGLWVYRRFPVSLPSNSTFNMLLRFGQDAAPLNNVIDFKVVLVGGYRQAVEIA